MYFHFLINYCKLKHCWFIQSQISIILVFPIYFLYIYFKRLFIIYQVNIKDICDKIQNSSNVFNTINTPVSLSYRFFELQTNIIVILFFSTLMSKDTFYPYLDTFLTIYIHEFQYIFYFLVRNTSVRVQHHDCSLSLS